jgi:flavin reductase (DIM6/NTAB) family NADH-FMN oxidoreductase RutF
MQEFPLAKTFHWIEPGQVVLVTTSSEGRANIMTMSWHMMLEFEPPLIGCCLGPWDFTYEALRATRECVIAIPTVDLAEKVVDIGNISGREVDKFARFGLTAMPAGNVSAPLIAECLANLECRLVDTIDAYNMNILEVVKCWHDPERKERRTFHAVGDGTFVVDGETMDLKKRMVRWPEVV